MRLLLVADLHYALPQFDWVVAHAGEYDIVVMSGDHLDIASPVDGRTQALRFLDRRQRVVGKMRRHFQANIAVVTAGRAIHRLE